MELVQDVNVERFDGESLWDLYRRSFPRRRRITASAPALTRDEFDAQLADHRVVKLVLLDRAGVDHPLGHPVGLATLTDDPAVIPAGPLALMQAAWPDRAEQRRLWFVGFLVVDPDHQQTGAASHLAGGIWTGAVAHGGVVTVDTARFNDNSVRLASALFHLARSISQRTTLQRVDDRGLWAYEFPEPVLV